MCASNGNCTGIGRGIFHEQKFNKNLHCLKVDKETNAVLD